MQINGLVSICYMMMASVMKELNYNLFLLVYHSFLLQKQSPRGLLLKGVLRNFAKFTGNHLCLRPATLLKKRAWHRCFTVNFAKFLRTPSLTEHLRWLLVWLLFRPVSTRLLVFSTCFYSFASHLPFQDHKVSTSPKAFISPNITTFGIQNNLSLSPCQYDF